MKTCATLLFASVLMLASAASAANLTGELVNGTTGEPGRADRIELIDVAQGMTPIATLEDVSGSFELTEVPESAAHLLLRITHGEETFSQNVESAEAPLRIEVYDSHGDVSAVELARHHVIFRRDGHHMLVTEMFEFLNASDPPRSITASAFPMRFGFANSIHGDIKASVGSGQFPVNLPVVETGTPQVLGVERALRPGTTRMFISYAIEYSDTETLWTNTTVYPTQDRRVLVQPADVQMMVDQMIPTEAPMEGYASYAGLPADPATSWTVRMAGGSAVADTGPATPGQVTRVEVRPHRFADNRVLLMVVVAAVLCFGLLVGVSRGGAGPSPDRDGGDKRKRALSKLADRYVTGELSRSQFETERDRILGGKAQAKRHGHANGTAKRTSTASRSS